VLEAVVVVVDDSIRLRAMALSVVAVVAEVLILIKLKMPLLANNIVVNPEKRVLAVLVKTVDPLAEEQQLAGPEPVQEGQTVVVAVAPTAMALTTPAYPVVTEEVAVAAMVRVLPLLVELQTKVVARLVEQETHLLLEEAVE